MADSPSNWVEARRQRQTMGPESDKEFLSFYRGTVADNKDPENLGRLKLRVPQIAGDNLIDTWAWPKGMISGHDFGDFMIPPIGSPVWVEFEQGNPKNPVWSGGGWAKEAGIVPEEAKTGYPKNRVRKSEKWVIEMDDDGEILKIKDTAGNNSFEITDGKINIKSDTEVNIDTQKFNVNAPGTGQMILGGATIAYNAGGLTITVGGKVLSIGAGGISVEGKSFLGHQHTGVDAGPDTTGGVL